MKRRTAILTLAGASGLAFVGLASIAAGCKGSEGEDEHPDYVPPVPEGPIPRAPIAVDLLLPAGSTLVGRSSLAPEPGKPLARPDFDRLFPGDDWGEIDGKTAMKRLRAQVRKDFKDREILSLNGWLVSWTEVELARVAYLISIGHLEVTEETRERSAGGLVLPRQDVEEAEPY